MNRGDFCSRFNHLFPSNVKTKPHELCHCYDFLFVSTFLQIFKLPTISRLIYLWGFIKGKHPLYRPCICYLLYKISLRKFKKQSKIFVCEDNVLCRIRWECPTMYPTRTNPISDLAINWPENRSCSKQREEGHGL